MKYTVQKLQFFAIFVFILGLASCGQRKSIGPVDNQSPIDEGQTAADPDSGDPTDVVTPNYAETPLSDGPISAPLNLNDGLKTTTLTGTPAMTWSTPLSVGSGLDRYEIALGTTAGATDALPYTAVGTATTTSLSGLTLQWGKTYYPIVRAVDLSGAVSTGAAGDGFVVGTLESTTMRNLLIFYGYPGSFNSTSHDNCQWNLDCVAGVMKNYSIIVLGLDLSNASGHPDRANTTSIISKVNALQAASAEDDKTNFYGYIFLGNTTVVPTEDLETVIKPRIAVWKAMGAKGIFIDEAGFDFWSGTDAEMRTRQNLVIDAVHAQGLKVIVNAWDPDDIFVKESGNPTRLQAGDGYFYESYLISTVAQTFAQYREKIAKIKAAKASLGIKAYGVSHSSDGITDFSASNWHSMIASGHLDGLDAVGWGVASFASSTSANPYREVPSNYRSFYGISEVAQAVDDGAETIQRILYNQTYSQQLGTLQLNYSSRSSNVSSILP